MRPLFEITGVMSNYAMPHDILFNATADSYEEAIEKAKEGLSEWMEDDTDTIAIEYRDRLHGEWFLYVQYHGEDTDIYARICKTREE